MKYDNQSKGMSWSAGFFMLIAFTIAAMVFFNLIAIQVGTALTGKPADTLFKGKPDPSLSYVYKLIQVINMLAFVVPTLITAYILHKQPLRILGYRTRFTPAQVMVVFFIVTAAVFVGGGLSYLNELLPIPASWKATFDTLEKTYQEQANAIMNLKTTNDYIIALIVMGFIPAFCEETLFRGGLQNFLTRSVGNGWLAILIVSLIFSAAHFSHYGFFFRFLLGAVMGFIYLYSGSLWLCIIAHFLNNAFVVSVYFWYVQKGKSLEEAGAGSPESFWGLAALPVLILLFIFLKRISFNTVRSHTRLAGN